MAFTTSHLNSFGSCRRRFLSNGTVPSNATSRSNRANTVLDCINRTAIAMNAANASDMTAGEALAKCGWTTFSDELDRSTQWEIIQADYLLNNKEISLRWMLPDAT
jgi:hypothetical protein